jgi:hypothetical protein
MVFSATLYRGGQFYWWRKPQQQLREGKIKPKVQRLNMQKKISNKNNNKRYKTNLEIKILSKNSAEKSKNYNIMAREFRHFRVHKYHGEGIQVFQSTQISWLGNLGISA